MYVTVSDPPPARGKGSLEPRVKSRNWQLSQNALELGVKIESSLRFREKNKKLLFTFSIYPLTWKLPAKSRSPGGTWLFNSNLPLPVSFLIFHAPLSFSFFPFFTSSFLLEHIFQNPENRSTGNPLLGVLAYLKMSSQHSHLIYYLTGNIIPCCKSFLICFKGNFPFSSILGGAVEKSDSILSPLVCDPLPLPSSSSCKNP